MVMEDELDLVQVVKTVLDEQYDATLLFCNCQMSLFGDVVMWKIF